MQCGLSQYQTSAVTEFALQAHVAIAHKQAVQKHSQGPASYSHMLMYTAVQVDSHLTQHDMPTQSSKA